MIFGLLGLTPESNTLLIALLIPILGVVSPLLIARQINKAAHDSKQDDWDRQDIVAERAEAVAKQAAEAASLVIERQHELDVKTDEVARRVEMSTNMTNTQLEKIHGLVNSQMTQALRSELAATKDTLALMSELIVNNKKNNIEPTTQVLDAVANREAKITELEENLRVREEADAASKLVNVGPREVVIVNPDPVPVVDTASPTTPGEVVIVNPDPVSVVDESEERK